MMFAQDSPLVILDTSVFLSALLSKNPVCLVKLFVIGERVDLS